MVKMTAEQREWAERKVGQEIKLRKGTAKVVDYKPDTVGAGVYLIVDKKNYDHPSERFDEVPVNYPHKIQSGAFWNQRVKPHRANGVRE